MTEYTKDDLERKNNSVQGFNYSMELIEEGLIEGGQILVVDFKNKCLSNQTVKSKMVTKKKSKKRKSKKSNKKAS